MLHILTLVSARKPYLRHYSFVVRSQNKDYNHILVFQSAYWCETSKSQVNVGLLKEQRIRFLHMNS